MGDTKRVFVINRSLRSEHIRIFPTIKAMCEIMNKEYKSKAYDSVTLKGVLFNMNALRNLNWKHPQKYKGHTIRQIGVERVPKEGETHLDFGSSIMDSNGIEGPTLKGVETSENR